MTNEEIVREIVEDFSARAAALEIALEAKLLDALAAKDAETERLKIAVAELLFTTRWDDHSLGWMDARKRAVEVMNGAPVSPRTTSLRYTIEEVGSMVDPPFYASILSPPAPASAGEPINNAAGESGDCVRSGNGLVAEVPEQSRAWLDARSDARPTSPAVSPAPVAEWAAGFVKSAPACKTCSGTGRYVPLYVTARGCNRGQSNGCDLWQGHDGRCTDNRKPCPSCRPEGGKS